jgi:large subunit ribosomal protein L3
MINDLFATKIGMTQAWTQDGKRLAVTRCSVGSNVVVGKQQAEVLDKSSQARKTSPATILEIGYGQKKLKNISKPLRSKLEKGGFNFGVKNIRGTRVIDTENTEQLPEVGQTIAADQVLSVGDVVQVQGITRGKGFTGVVKRYGFAGGPRTHGQSDRLRAVGSIGAGTTPGRVWPGKRMAGRGGNETVTVRGLVVLYIDPNTGELWLSGPVPGSVNSELKISKMGIKKNIQLDKSASGLPETEPAKPEEAKKADEPAEEIPEAEQTVAEATTNESEEK